MQVVTQQLAVGEAEELLQEHLTGNLVRVGHSWHIQSRGIPQVPWSLNPPPHARTHAQYYV